jgi:hypothetical protein
MNKRKVLYIRDENFVGAHKFNVKNPADYWNYLMGRYVWLWER